MPWRLKYKVPKKKIEALTPNRATILPSGLASGAAVANLPVTWLILALHHRHVQYAHPFADCAWGACWSHLQVKGKDILIVNYN